MNQITAIQNTEKQLERLAAQRELYSSAKRLYFWQLAGNLLIPLSFTTISLFYTSLSFYSALYGLCFYLFDSLIFEPTISKRKTKAAKIQELFDCDVLEIDKSDFKTVSDITVEEVLTHYDAHKKIETNIEKIKDWYPKEVAELDISVARLICQRMNYCWDSRLRVSYSNLLKVVNVVLIVIVIVSVSVGHSTGDQTLLIASGLLPFFRFSIKQYQENKDSSEKLTKLNAYFDKLWAKILKNEIDKDELDETARRIQDEIYDNRIKNPLIPDLFYKFYRSKDEFLMSRSAGNLVKEIETSKNIPLPNKHS